MAAQDEMRREAGAMKDEARGLWNDATDAARSAATRQQQAAADSLGSFAGVLRDAAQRTDTGDGTSSRMAQSLADGLDRFSRSLKGRDLGGLLRDVENFARAQPLVFFGVAVATGFVATRFLKSSAPGDDTRGLLRTEADPAGVRSRYDASSDTHRSAAPHAGTGTTTGRDSVLDDRKAMQGGLGGAVRDGDSALSSGAGAMADHRDQRPAASGASSNPGSDVRR